jgi:hypothetical protein
MNYNYSNLEQLLGHVRKINDKYYWQAVGNVAYLEELGDKNYIIYITSLRDAYDHLVQVLSAVKLFTL